MHTGFLLLGAFVTAVCASPVLQDLFVLEQRSTIPAGFVKTVAAPADTVLNLRIALTQSDRDGLEEALYAVSTPGSDSYGQHLTKEEVEKYVAPSSESVSLVNEWLSSNGITAETISPAGDWSQFSIPVSQANTLLNAEFSIFNHSASGQQLTRTLSYSIPSSLKGHVDLVHPTITFDRAFNGPSRVPIAAPKASRGIKPGENLGSRADLPDFCDDFMVPTCLLPLYNIPSTLATQSSNVLAVSGSVLICLRTLPSNTTFALQTLDGGENPQDLRTAGLEASLDIQYTVGVASGVPTVFISVGDDNQDGRLFGFLDIVNFLLSEESPPLTFTTSYGADESTMSPELATRLCDAYIQLGARGVSVLFASGDGGVGGGQPGEVGEIFEPTFPSGCPFLTSVGATTGTTETAATLSSGGFSNIFSRPSYQNASASAYFAALGSTNSGRFNTSGRGFPDVSAQGEKIPVSIGGNFFNIQGTSASSPIFASVVALVNDRLIAAGKPPLGFLNPFLYSASGAAALNNITTGSNPGCETDGFPAKAGWDPVTGLGTPNFAALLAAALEL